MGYIELECWLGTMVHDALTHLPGSSWWLPTRVPGFSSLWPLVRPVRTGDLREAFQESWKQNQQGFFWSSFESHPRSFCHVQNMVKACAKPSADSGSRERDPSSWWEEWIAEEPRHGSPGAVLSVSHSCWSSLTSDHLWLGVCGILVGKYVRLKCKCTVYFSSQYISECTYVHVTF